MITQQFILLQHSVDVCNNDKLQEIFVKIMETIDIEISKLILLLLANNKQSKLK